MNSIPELSDEEFVPFLQDLGVETYKKSFEWMLNDTNFAGVLIWLYKNLDHNNVLTAREEYRYKELEKIGCLLSPEDLASSIVSIEEQYPGICIPGDQEGRADVEMDIKMQRERLNLLEKQEMVVKDLIRENDRIKEELTVDLACLNASHRQCVDDEDGSAEECAALAQELDAIAEDVVATVAENLEVYTTCKSDKETAARFFTFAQLQSYSQTQALFRSHFELYASRHLFNKRNDDTDDEMRGTLVQAREMEERLLDAAFAYIDSKAELSGVLAKLQLVSTYDNVHPSQITSNILETQSALELLEQEEHILEQEMQNAVQQLVKSRTSLAVNTAATAAVSVRQQILSSLSHLADVWQQAFSLDRVLYLCLRHELRTLEEFVQFASQLNQYIVNETCAISSRMASMSEICADQESCELKQASNPLLSLLSTTLSVPCDDASIMVKLYNDLWTELMELKRSAEDGVRRREDGLEEMRKSTKPLLEYIWDGCTKQPNCWDRTVATLTHTLRQDMEVIDKKVLDASSLFTSTKNDDKQNLRKLCQWFLTDPPRLHAAIKNNRSF